MENKKSVTKEWVEPVPFLLQKYILIKIKNEGKRLNVLAPIQLEINMKKTENIEIKTTIM